MKKILRITKLLLALTILLSSTVFQPVNSYALIDKDELLELIQEKGNFVESHFFGACYFGAYNYDLSIQLGDPENDWPHYRIDLADGDPILYEDLKKQFLERTTAYGFMICASNIYTSILNINGAAYVQYHEGITFGESGFAISELDIIARNENTIMTIGRSFIDGHNLFQEYVITLEKVNDSWNISWISGAFGISPLNTTKWQESVFVDYIKQTILSYIISENINCGYEKFSQETNRGGILPAEITVDSFDSEECTGKAHTILDEYDENGNVISQHKIVVEIGENLSEKVTDYILSSENPNTADIDLVFIILAAVSAATGIFLLNKKRQQTT